jgi:hypothetical protein
MIIPLDAYRQVPERLGSSLTYLDAHNNQIPEHLREKHGMDLQKTLHRLVPSPCRCPTPLATRFPQLGMLLTKCSKIPVVPLIVVPNACEVLSETTV